MLETELVPALASHSRHLMIVLHGLGDSMEGYRWLPQMMKLPWLNYLLVNAPDPYYGGYSWYDFAGNPEPGVRRSRELLFKLLDQQRGSGFPTGHTFLFGFSQGCLMTIEAGLRYPHRFAGLVGISGYAFQPQQLIQEFSTVARQQRFLITHGTEDSLIPIAPVRGQIALLQSAGAQIEWHEFAKDHTIAGEEELSVIREFVSSNGPRKSVSDKA
ncbi:MAG: serine esterase [Verrucomicrobia bacterium]|nr:serine esterase [Verrucomicrobiota bacterium]